MAQPQHSDLQAFIVAHFKREELNDFCLRYFREVYEDNEGSDIEKSAYARRLLTYCERREFEPHLLAALQRERPQAYARMFGPPAAQVAPSSPADAPIKPNPRQVFLSHAHEDAEFAQRLAHDLREAGLSVWMTPDSIPQGEPWVSAIDRGLGESGIFVVVLTPNAVRSKWVKKETQWALGAEQEDRVKLLPLWVQPCQAAQLSNLLTTTQYVNFERSYEDGLEVLCRAVGVQTVAMQAAEQQRAREAAEQEVAEFERLRAENERLKQAALAGERQRAAEADRERLRQENERLRGEMEEQAKTQPVAKGASADEMTIQLAAGVKMILRRIPAGEFLMGSNKAIDNQANDNELPQHTVTLPEYFIGKYPVTNEQWQVFARATSREFSLPKGKTLHPVIEVNWHDAMAFCDWLSQASGYKVRLPSEPEWEKAARGTDGRIYPWGNAPPTKDKANYYGTSIFKLFSNATSPVGRYSPQGDSPYGCADMAGNVWEWTRSLWGKDSGKPAFSYPYVAGDGREKLMGNDDVRRVVRGGSWDNDHGDVRAAVRDGGVPSYRGSYLGLRVVVSAPVS